MTGRRIARIVGFYGSSGGHGRCWSGTDSEGAMLGRSDNGNRQKRKERAILTLREKLRGKDCRDANKR